MKILVVQHVSYESSGILSPYFRELGHRVSTLRLYEKTARFSRDLFNNDLFVFVGGPMSVNDEKGYPFLRHENLFIQDLTSKKKAILGVCLGSQLVAKALGARIYRAPEKEIGWYPVNLTQEGLQDTCFKPLGLEPGKRLRVFHWHGETFDLPKKAVRLASSSVCPNQAFKYNDRTYAVQFHLEMNRILIKRWLDHGGNEIEQNGFDGNVIRVESNRYLARLQKNARVFIDSFINRIGKN